MKLSELQPSLLGQWTGSNQLWLEGEAGPVRHSSTGLVVTLVAKGAYLSFAYTWADAGEPQEGLLLVGCNNAQRSASAAWGDSWHMSERLMQCEGGVGDDGAITLLGSYAAPPGPPWGWRIVLSQSEADALQIRMFNIPPGAEGVLAVQADYRRSGVASEGETPWAPS